MQEECLFLSTNKQRKIQLYCNEFTNSLVCVYVCVCVRRNIFEEVAFEAVVQGSRREK